MVQVTSFTTEFTFSHWPSKAVVPARHLHCWLDVKRRPSWKCIRYGGPNGWSCIPSRKNLCLMYKLAYMYYLIKKHKIYIHRRIIKEQNRLGNKEGSWLYTLDVLNIGCFCVAWFVCFSFITIYPNLNNYILILVVLDRWLFYTYQATLVISYSILKSLPSDWLPNWNISHINSFHAYFDTIIFISFWTFIWFI